MKMKLTRKQLIRLLQEIEYRNAMDDPQDFISDVTEFGYKAASQMTVKELKTRLRDYEYEYIRDIASDLSIRLE